MPSKVYHAFLHQRYIKFSNRQVSILLLLIFIIIMGKSDKNNDIDSRVVRQTSRRIPTTEQVEDWIIRDKRLSAWLLKKTSRNCDNTLQTLYNSVIEDIYHDPHITDLHDPGQLVVGINVLNWTLWYAQYKVILGSEVKVLSDWRYDVWGKEINTAPTYIQQ